MAAPAFWIWDKHRTRGAFRCPGCQRDHNVSVGGEATWQWNGDTARPTLSPSVLVTYNGPDAGIEGAPAAVCHSFVRDGQIEFLGDCTHALAGQSVPLPPCPHEQFQ